MNKQAVPGGVSICEMLFNSSLVAIVGYDSDSSTFSPRHLQLFNTQIKQKIHEVTFLTPILAVKLNKKRLVRFTITVRDDFFFFVKRFEKNG